MHRHREDHMMLKAGIRTMQLQGKGSHDKMERQPAEGEKVFANDMADKGLISNVYKQLTQFDIKKN